MRRLLVAALAALFVSACASAPEVPSPDHPRAACYLSCSDGRPLRSTIQRDCVAGGKIRGKDISVSGEVNDGQNPHASVWLAGKESERGAYPKDSVVWGTCTMFHISRGAVDEHMIGVLNTPRAERP